MLVPTHILYLSLGMFALGVFGVLTRRNAIVILMSIELMLNAANLNFIAFSWALGSVVGQIFALFVICVAAGEVAVGLAILITLIRNSESVNVEEFHILKG